jgi:PGF-CTERM protein
MRERLTYRSAVTLGAALLVIVSSTVGAVAVSGLTVTQLTNSEVESGQSVDHTLSIEADELSADGTDDTIYVQLPDAYAGNASFSSVTVVNRSSGQDIPVSSSTSLVDGPDGDGNVETLRTGVSRSADYDTDDINATYQFTLSHPSVTETTSYDVTIIIEDSAGDTTETTVEDAITVTAGEGGMDSGDGMDGDDGMDSMDGETDDESSGADGDGTETTSGDGPGFTAVLAVLGLITGTALLARRR